jgi:hypothetical protein
MFFHFNISSPFTVLHTSSTYIPHLYTPILNYLFFSSKIFSRNNLYDKTTFIGSASCYNFFLLIYRIGVILHVSHAYIYSCVFFL